MISQPEKRKSQTMDTPHLTFFCELDPQPLQELFSSPTLVRQLQQLNACVSLGLIDLSPQRAEIVRFLNQQGIPVSAWLLLSKDVGYWCNLDNAQQALDRYHDFKSWSENESLTWNRIGLDIEPDLKALQILAKNKRKGIQQFLQKANRRRFENGKRVYGTLLEEIHQDGYLVESYQFPFIVDERKARSHLVQRLTGVLDLPVDREVLMLYSSFYPGIGPGMLCSYGKTAQGIGLGSTGGGVTMEGLANPNPLNGSQFQRDLLLAARASHWLYIFSLEGCVLQEFLEKLIDFDWNQEPKRPEAEINQVEWARFFLQGILRFSRLFY
jgi:hypothetical protein